VQEDLVALHSPEEYQVVEDKINEKVSFREATDRRSVEHVATLKDSVKSSFRHKLKNVETTDKDWVNTNELPLSSEDERHRTCNGEPIFIEVDQRVSTSQKK